MKTINPNLLKALRDKEVNPCNKCWIGFPQLNNYNIGGYRFECQCGRKGPTMAAVDGARWEWNKFNPLNFSQKRQNESVKSMKIQDLKIGDLIQIKSSACHGHPQEYVKIVDFGPKNGILVYETHLSGGGQWWITRDDVIAKMESTPIEPEKIYTFTETELNHFCKAVVELERHGYKYCVDFGYDNVLEQAKKRGLI